MGSSPEPIAPQDRLAPGGDQIAAAPFRHIIVGYDFSDDAHVALDQAMGLARHAGARITLVHAGCVPEEPEVPPSMAATARAYRQVLLERLEESRQRLDEVRHRHSGQGVELSQLFVDGFADTALAEAARQLGADLIVVGSHGRTGFRRLLLGSVAEQTIRAADCSVLVVRGQARPEYRTILVGTDFSPIADRALSRALAVAAAGADIHLVHCWMVDELPIERDLPPAEVVPQLRSDLAQMGSERGRALLSERVAPGARLRFDAIEAVPSAGLDVLAAVDHADLVVVGTHGHRGLRRLVLGSVAEATVRHAPCSVLVVR
jgi:nucleotide-binding universal stress UspA family protein